jgi:hypothetical protein
LLDQLGSLNEMRDRAIHASHDLTAGALHAPARGHTPGELVLVHGRFDVEDLARDVREFSSSGVRSSTPGALTVGSLARRGRSGAAGCSRRGRRSRDDSISPTSRFICPRGSWNQSVDHARVVNTLSLRQLNSGDNAGDNAPNQCRRSGEIAAWPQGQG